MKTNGTIMTPEQVAEYLQLDRETIYRYIRSGKLNASKFGRAYRVRESDVESLLKQNRVVPEYVPREYTDGELAEYMKADEISDEAREVLRQFAAKYR